LLKTKTNIKHLVCAFLSCLTCYLRSTD